MADPGEDRFPASLVLVGAGKMGGALLDGWLRLGLEGSRVRVIDPAPSAAVTALCKANSVALGPPPVAPDFLVLAVKPQSLEGAAPALLPLIGPDTLVVSIMAGKTVADIEARLPAKVFIRAMPNLPAAIGRGVTGAFASSGVTPTQREQADGVLGAVGDVEWVADEGLIDAVTAVSGSGPAYVFYLVECLAKAGEAAGLPSDTAARLARATIEGAGELLFRTPTTSPETFRLDVTSPGGTTAAALEVLLQADGLAPLMRRAIAAAHRRAAELSG